jgi:acyl carrier protein
LCAAAKTPRREIMAQYRARIPHHLTCHGLSSRPELVLNTEKEVLTILDEVLSLRGRSANFDRATPLLGALPELDSMAVVSVITMLEERFGFVVEDDELDGSTFETVGTLVTFVDRKRQ